MDATAVFAVLEVLCGVAASLIGRMWVRQTLAQPPRDLASRIQELREHRLDTLRAGWTGTAACAAGTYFTAASEHPGASGRVVGAVLAYTCAAIALPLPGWPFRVAITRLRGVPLHPPGRWRALALRCAFAPVTAAASVLAWALHRQPGSVRFFLVAVLVDLGLLAVTLLSPRLLLAATGRAPVPADLTDRVRALAGRMAVPVPRLVVLPDHGLRMANAFAAGVVPGDRYLLVTAELLEALPADQVDAVLAHELGHLKDHHAARRVATVQLVCLPLAVLGALLWGRVASPLQPPLALCLVMVANIPVIRWLAIRQELAADAAAARAVGGPVLADALVALGRANDVPENTGEAWAKQVGHPGLGKRIDLLRRSSPAAPARAAIRHR